MKVIESEGKTREEAIEKGLKELGVDMHDLEKIDVIDEGSRGFLGLGTRPVRVRLTIDMPEQPRRRDQQRGARSDNERGRRPERRQNNDEQRRPREQQPAEADARNGRRKKKSRRRKGQDETEQRANDRRGGGKPGGRQHKDDRRPQQAGNTHKASPITGKPVATISEEADEAMRRAEQFDNHTTEAEHDNGVHTEELPLDARPDEEIEPITDEQGNEAAAVLAEMLNKMELEGTIEFKRCDDGSARLVIDSDADGGILIGKRGVTLNAIQYLINRMIARGDAQENSERLVVDVGGYVDRRKATLIDMAKSMAKRAKETRRNIRLKPLSPQERRIIHLTLEQDQEVRTYSTGDSLFRSIVINPTGAKRGNNRRRDRNERPPRRHQQEMTPSHSDE